VTRFGSRAGARRHTARGGGRTARGGDLVAGSVTSPPIFGCSEKRERHWARFIEGWESGIRQGGFESEKFTTDITKNPDPALRSVEARAIHYYGVQFARGCPFTCEVLRHHRALRAAPAAVKTAEQMPGRARSTLSASDNRGILDFVDATSSAQEGGEGVPAAFDRLAKERGYPFEFSTEASINLADDDALLALMREANFPLRFSSASRARTPTRSWRCRKSRIQGGLWLTACTRLPGRKCL